MATRFSEEIRADAGLRISGGELSFSVTPSSEWPISKIAQKSNAVHTVDLTSMRVHDAPHTNLPGTAATDDIALLGTTYGTNSLYLSAGDSKATSVTRYARFSFQLPPNYDDGQTITLRIHAGMLTTISDTSATVDAQCYVSDEESALDGAGDICATAAQSINSVTLADKDFTITPTGRVAGEILDIRLTLACTDGATGTTVEPVIGSVKMLIDTRG